MGILDSLENSVKAQVAPETEIMRHRTETGQQTAMWWLYNEFKVEAKRLRLHCNTSHVLNTYFCPTHSGGYGSLNLLKCRLPLDSFDTHMYVVGKTKKGKSKFLEHIALQLITGGQGCSLPGHHTDMADHLPANLAKKMPAWPFALSLCQPHRIPAITLTLDGETRVPAQVIYAGGEPEWI